jgi:hypothetical protein
MTDSAAPLGADPTQWRDHPPMFSVPDKGSAQKLLPARRPWRCGGLRWAWSPSGL